MSKRKSPLKDGGSQDAALEDHGIGPPGKRRKDPSSRKEKKSAHDHKGRKPPGANNATTTTKATKATATKAAKRVELKANARKAAANGGHQQGYTAAQQHNASRTARSGRPETNDFCYICKQRGHWAKECPAEQRAACFVCGRLDHTGRNCPTRKKNVRPPLDEEDLLILDAENERTAQLQNKFESEVTAKMNPFW
jgi:hypothetical protein